MQQHPQPRPETLCASTWSPDAHTAPCGRTAPVLLASTRLRSASMPSTAPVSGCDVPVGSMLLCTTAATAGQTEDKPSRCESTAALTLRVEVMRLRTGPALAGAERSQTDWPAKAPEEREANARKAAQQERHCSRKQMHVGF